MKRSPLKRKSPMKRTRSRPGKSKTKYARRERDFPRMTWTREQRCALASWDLSSTEMLASWEGWAVELSPCSGAIEAHHAGVRAGWRKADDSTVVPLCQMHHRSLTDRTGAFSGWPRGALKTWELAAVAHYSARYSKNLDSDGDLLF